MQQLLQELFLLLLLPPAAVLITVPRASYQRNISSLCTDAVSEIYDSTFGSAEKSFFMNRDRYLWNFRIMQCIRRIANETVTVPSITPTYYCYGDVRCGQQTIVLGACLPSQCYSDRQQLLEEYENRLDLPKNASSIENIYCIRSRKQKAWYERPLTIVDFFINKLLILFALFGTIYQTLHADPPKSCYGRAILAFSVAENVKAFVPDKTKNKISCVDGLRVLSTLWVIIGHSFWLVKDFVGNVDQYENDLGKSFWAQWITNFTVSVDTFFTLSGLLTSYLWFLRLKESGEDIKWNSWKHWLQFYVHRFLRLWPAYMYIMWVITASISEFGYFTYFPPTNPSVQCPKHWWENALFINSLTTNKCVGWTWYISTTFIFHLISPVFLLAFKRSLRYGLLLSINVTILSSLLNIVQIYRYNYPPTQMLFAQPNIYNQNYYEREITMYIGPQYRIGPYLVGLSLGCILSKIKNKRVTKMSSSLMVLEWTGATVVGLSSLFGLYPTLLGLNWPIYNLIYGGFHRTLWSLWVAWIIYACQEGIAGPVAVILQCPLFSIIAPLCYSVYLIHMAAIIVVYSLLSFPMYYHSIPQVMVYCGIQVLLSSIVALANVFLVELPANNLEQLLLFPRKTEKPITFGEKATHKHPTCVNTERHE